MDEDSKKQTFDRADKVIVEISQERLQELLAKADLKIGENIRIIKGLEIQPGSVIAKQYDR